MLVLTGATTGVTTAKETEDSGETVCNLRRMEALPPPNLLLEGLAHYVLTSCVSVVIALGIMRTIVPRMEMAHQVTISPYRNLVLFLCNHNRDFRRRLSSLTQAQLSLLSLTGG